MIFEDERKLSEILHEVSKNSLFRKYLEPDILKIAEGTTKVAKECGISTNDIQEGNFTDVFNEIQKGLLSGNSFTTQSIQQPELKQDEFIEQLNIMCDEIDKIEPIVTEIDVNATTFNAISELCKPSLTMEDFQRRQTLPSIPLVVDASIATGKGKVIYSNGTEKEIDIF